MKKGNNHGIASSNLRIPPRGWRIIVLFRNLKPIIKRQAMNHLKICQNQDSKLEVMLKCECKNVQ